MSHLTTLTGLSAILSFSAGSLLPGQLVTARVRNVLSDGLLASFLTYFRCACCCCVEEQHMPGCCAAGTHCLLALLTMLQIHVPVLSSECSGTVDPFHLGTHRDPCVCETQN